MRAARFVGICVMLTAILLLPDYAGHASAFLFQSEAVGTLALNGRVAYLIGLLAGGAFLMVAARWLGEYGRGRRCLAIGATIVWFISAVAFAYGTANVATIGSIGLGFAFITTLGVPFLWLVDVQDTRSMVAACAIALAAKAALLSLLDVWLPSTLAKPVLLLIPVIYGVFAFVGEVVASTGECVPNGRGVPHYSGHAARIAFAVLLMSSVTFAATRASSGMGMWGQDSPVVVMDAAQIFVYSFAFLAVCYASFALSTGNVLVRFLPALVILLIGYSMQQGAPLASAMPQGAIGGIVGMYMELYGHMLDLMVILMVMCTLYMPGLRVLGIQTVCFAIVELALLIMASLTSLALSFIAILILYIVLGISLAILYIVHVSDRASAIRESLSVVSPAQTSRNGVLGETTKPGKVGGNCEAQVVTADATSTASSSVLTSLSLRNLSSKFDLSAREEEVFVLIVQGRSRSYICSELGLAAGTVASYSARVYDKFRVHGKQELIDVVYEQLGLNEM